MRTTDPARRRCAQNADHLALNSPFSAFFTEVVCTLSAAPPRTATSLPQNGGNDVIRAATRRRHAASQLLMLHPPAGQIGNQRRAYSPRLVPNCGIRGQRRGLADLQSDADHPPTHQAPPVWRATRELRDERGLAVELGGGARGRRGLDGMCTAMKTPPVWRVPEGPEGLAGLQDRPLRAAGSRIEGTTKRGLAAAHRHTHPHNNNQHSQRHEAATSFPATASSRSISATQQSGTASDQAVMSTWSSTAARPASRRATGTRNGEQDT